MQMVALMMFGVSFFLFLSFSFFLSFFLSLHFFVFAQEKRLFSSLRRKLRNASVEWVFEFDLDVSNSNGHLARCILRYFACRLIWKKHVQDFSSNFLSPFSPFSSCYLLSLFLSCFLSFADTLADTQKKKGCQSTKSRFNLRGWNGLRPKVESVRWTLGISQMQQAMFLLFQTMQSPENSDLD
jgi:hypothetical protein